MHGRIADPWGAQTPYGAAKSGRCGSTSTSRVLTDSAADASAEADWFLTRIKTGAALTVGHP